MKRFFKKHVGLIVLLVMILAFPASMSTQARLNMRIIITGLAVDKTDDGYEVTAQIVKTTPSSESSGTGATINFISDTGETLVSAIAKLSYKAGKVAGFSHTNFVLLGNKMLDSDLSKNMDYFVRDNIIKDSVLLLIAKGSAKEEIMKTKDVELSVGLGLQKVFMYKEKESDGIMTTLLSFMNKTNSKSQTAVASVLSLNSNEAGEDSEGSSGDSESSDSSSSSGSDGGSSDISGSPKESESSDKSSSESSSGSSSGSSGKSSGGESGGSSESEEGSSGSSGSSGGSSGGSGGGQGGGSSYQYFDAMTPLVCFVSGKHVGNLETEDEIMGFMFAQNKSESEDLSVDGLDFGKLAGAKIGVKIKYKRNSFKIRYEQNTPCLDVNVKIKNASLKEIQTDGIVDTLTKQEFEYVKTKIAEYISEKIAITFEKARQMGADVFGAYTLADKYFYNKTKNNFSSLDEFLSALKLNVKVRIDRLEY